jgi:hypothetical protein
MFITDVNKKRQLLTVIFTAHSYTRQVLELVSESIEKLLQEIQQCQYQILLTSPEMCLKHPKFSLLLRTPSFSQHVFAFVIDEAHYVSQWGKNFCKKFSELGKLRSNVSIDVPFLATSVMLPPHILKDVKLPLCFSPAQTFSVNLGNERLNITSLVCCMKTCNDLRALNFILHEDTLGLPLIRTVIFLNLRDLTYGAFVHLQNSVSNEARDQIGFLHSMRAKGTKKRVMSEFRNGTSQRHWSSANVVKFITTWILNAWP